MGIISSLITIASSYDCSTQTDIIKCTNAGGVCGGLANKICQCGTATFVGKSADTCVSGGFKCGSGVECSGVLVFCNSGKCEKTIEAFVAAATAIGTGLLIVA